jgi:predicted TIM-barrel fold metal-dependent hydrolase
LAEDINVIDIFSHIIPDRYREELYKRGNRSEIDAMATHQVNPALYDLDLRLKVMEKYEDMRQVLTINSPALEMVVSPTDAVELARLANDEMAEIVAKYPNRFIAGVACLPMNDVDVALREAERAIEQLGMKGVELYTPCGERPLDTPEFFPLYQMMAGYDLPIWIHPIRKADVPEYLGETGSKDRTFQAIGWPYDTSLGMVRLVLGGVFDKYPSLKVIIHHCGAMIPFFISRIGRVWPDKEHYFKMFYADTALSGNTAGLMCGYECFGADHLLFGSDAPHGDPGPIIASVERMDIPAEAKKKIFTGNARRLLRI